jgi:hypothetical protein
VSNTSRCCRRAFTLALVLIGVVLPSAASAGLGSSAIADGKVSCAYTRFTQSVGVYVWKTGPVRCPKARSVMHRWVKHRREARGWDCWPGRKYYICDRPGPGRAYAVVDPLPGMGD